MSTSPLRQVFETAAPSDLVNIQRPTAGGFTAIDASVPMAALSNSRFDVTFTGLEFRNIGTTPLVLIESNRTIIITSANAILTEQTEAFEFIDAFAIILTNAVYPQLVESGKISNSPHFNILNSSFVFNHGDRSSILGQGNATISTDGVDSLTGDGFVRILGTYYEIDL
jgi:hypothetical protein